MKVEQTICATVRFNNLLAAASGDASGNAILAIDMEFPGFLRQDSRSEQRNSCPKHVQAVHIHEYKQMHMHAIECKRTYKQKKDTHIITTPNPK